MPRSKSTADRDASAADAERVELKRVRAGEYRTADGRFSVEQESGRWLIVDTEQTNELGLPLVRGPFATLDDARDGLAAARLAPTPQSPLEGRIREAADRPKPTRPTAPAHPTRRSTRAGREPEAPSAEPEPAPGPPEIVARRLRPVEAGLLRRALETDLGRDAVDFSFGADEGPAVPSEAGVRRFLGRPDGHAVIALADDRVVGLLVMAEALTLGEPGTLLLVERCRLQADRRDEIGGALREAVAEIARTRPTGPAVLVVDADGAGALAALGLPKRHAAPDRLVVELDLSSS